MSDKSSQPVSDEDQMSAALAELREAKAAPEGAPVVEAASQEAAPVVVDQQAGKAGPAKETERAAAATAAAEAAASATRAAEESPEQKLATAQAELQRVRSEIGRVNALNAKATEQARELSQLRQQLAEKTAPPKTEAEARSKLAALAEQVKDFPELLSVVQGVDAALKEVEGRAQAQAEKAAQEAVRPLEPLRQRHLDQQASEQEAANAADLRTFSGTYPSAGDVIKTDDFKTWLPKQSQAIQWAFFKGQTPADALPVMDAYDAHLRRSGKPSIAQAPTTTQPPAANEQPAKPANDRLTRATGIPSRASSGSKGALPPEDDFEGSLEFFRNKRMAEARRAAA